MFVVFCGDPCAFWSVLVVGFSGFAFFDFCFVQFVYVCVILCLFWFFGLIAGFVVLVLFCVFCFWVCVFGIVGLLFFVVFGFVLFFVYVCVVVGCCLFWFVCVFCLFVCLLFCFVFIDAFVCWRVSGFLLLFFDFWGLAIFGVVGFSVFVGFVF